MYADCPFTYEQFLGDHPVARTYCQFSEHIQFPCSQVMLCRQRGSGRRGLMMFSRDRIDI